MARVSFQSVSVVRVTHLSSSSSRVTGVCSAPQASMRALRPLTEEQEIQRVIPFYGRTDFGDFLRMRTQKKVGSVQTVRAHPRGDDSLPRRWTHLAVSVQRQAGKQKGQILHRTV